MKTNRYKTTSYVAGFILSAFLLKDIFKYLSFLRSTPENPINYLIPQGIYVLGLICLIAFYMVVLHTIKKDGIFVRKTEKTFRQFGSAILFLAISSNILFNYLVGEYSTNARWLALLGGTIAFFSFILQAGIKLKEEQDLTI